MNTASEALVARVLATSTITDLIADRIYALHGEEGQPTLPRLIVEDGDEERDRTYSGDTGLVKHEVTIYAHAASYTAAEELGRAVRDALDNEKGQWGSVRVAGCFHKGASRTRETNDGNEDTAVWNNETMYTVWISES